MWLCADWLVWRIKLVWLDNGCILRHMAVSNAGRAKSSCRSRSRTGGRGLGGLLDYVFSADEKKNGEREALRLGDVPWDG